MSKDISEEEVAALRAETNQILTGDPFSMFENKMKWADLFDAHDKEDWYEYNNLKILEILESYEADAMDRLTDEELTQLLKNKESW